MTMYFMFGKYSAPAIKGISASRTKESEQIIKKHGGIINAMYVLLGIYDIVLMVSFPSIEDVLQASLALTNLTGIAFSTMPAVTVTDFDKIAGKA